MSVPRVLLHGFGGSAGSWDAVRARPGGEPYPALAPDLRGHGAARGRRPVAMEDCVADVLAAVPARCVLAGYSLGGRVALRVALRAPERIERLVLVATTAGLEGDAERRSRIEADDALAAHLRETGAASFAARWSAQPLFAADPPAVRAAQEAEIAAGDPDGLAEALSGLSPGRVPPVWDRLGELDVPVTLLAGERDERYVALAHRLAAGLPDARVVVVPGAGHGLLREAPDEVRAAIWPR
jgi:2-succinyl-6-hydroxy-2,4-cyclohexadiene-1-carboxylate synthase